MTVKFTHNRKQRALITEIAKRAEKLELVNTQGERLALEMDITATHSNGNPLKLPELLVAKDFDFVHDVCGIRRHIDRRTGQLKDFFSPRYSAPEGA